jgi:hypothetical protein
MATFVSMSARQARDRSQGRAINETESVQLARRPLVLAACGAPWVRVGAQQPLQVVYPAPESGLDRRFDDMVDLLRMALTRTEARHGPFHLRPHAEFMSQARQVLELERG